MIAANKIDAIWDEEADPLGRICREFEPKGIKVFPISAVTGQGVRELLYYVQERLAEIPKNTKVFESEFDPELMIPQDDLPYTVSKSEEEKDTYIVEGPKIEKMLGYTNLDSEKGFAFFQKFLKDSGILDELEKAGITDGDTVRMYGHTFDYYK